MGRRWRCSPASQAHAGKSVSPEPSRATASEDRLLAERIGWRRSELNPAERLADARQAATEGNPQAQAWLQQAHYSLMRDRATILARTEATAIINEGLDDNPDATTRMLSTARIAQGVADDPLLDSLGAALESRDRDQLLAAVARLADSIGAKRIGGDPTLGPGQIVTFDRHLHDSIDGSVRPGQKVLLVSPGYTTTGPDGEDTVLFKAKVEEATPEEIRRASQ